MKNAELITELRGHIREVPLTLLRDVADALEAAEKRIDGLQKLVDINTERCEALRKQLREAHENYEKHINELEAQMPKEGEWRWLSSTYDRVPCEMRYWCSVCHHQEITHYDKPWKHYCPNCGAKMDGERKDGERKDDGK